MTVKVPEVGVSKAAIARRKVVFPHPLGPMKLTNSPAPMVRFTSFNACTGPSAVWKTRLRLWASITGVLTFIVSFTRWFFHIHVAALCQGAVLSNHANGVVRLPSDYSAANVA